MSQHQKRAGQTGVESWQFSRPPMKLLFWKLNCSFPWVTTSINMAVARAIRPRLLDQQWAPGAGGGGGSAEQWSFSLGIWTWHEKREAIFPSWMADLVSLGWGWWSWLPLCGTDKVKKLERKREGSSVNWEMWIDEKQREAYWVSNFSSSCSWEPVAFLSQRSMRHPSIILNYYQRIF